MCELCGGFNEVHDARICKDDGEKFQGHLCKECRTGRQLCPACNFLIPAHGLHCLAGPNAGSLD